LGSIDATEIEQLGKTELELLELETKHEAEDLTGKL